MTDSVVITAARICQRGGWGGGGGRQSEGVVGILVFNSCMKIFSCTLNAIIRG